MKRSPFAIQSLWRTTHPIARSPLNPAGSAHQRAKVIFCVQGVASPLLANIYMNRFLKHWRLSGRDEAFRAHVIAYADDFVILSRGHAGEALAWTKAVMTKIGLTINESKTSLKDARRERFDFLGYSFGRHYPYKCKPGVRLHMSA